MNKSFSVEKYSVQKYGNDSRFMQLTMNICCSNMEANKSIFTDDAIESGKDTFVNVPIVGKIKKTFQNPDFMGHELVIKKDVDGSSYTEYIEENIGMIPESANIRLEADPDFPERKWIVVEALIWAERNKVAKDVLRRRKKVDISMEVEFVEWEEKDGILVVHKFTALAVCLLGSTVRPGFKTSSATLREAFSEFKHAFMFALKEEEGEEVQKDNEMEDQKFEDAPDKEEEVPMKDDDKKEDERPEDYAEKVEAEFARMEGYEYFGCGKSAAFGFKDGMVYSFPYAFECGIIKMEDGCPCEIMAKYGVTHVPESKGEDIMLPLPSVDTPQKEIVIEEFACGEKMACKYADMMGKFNDMMGKYGEMEMKYADMEKEYNKVFGKLEEYTMKAEKEAFAQKVDEVLGKYTVSEADKTVWVEKAKTYADIALFEKDFVFDQVQNGRFSMKEDEVPGFKSKVIPRSPTTDADDNKDNFAKMRKQFNVGTKTKGGK